MYKKLFGVTFLLFGVLIFMGLGCGGKGLNKFQKQTNTNTADVCGPTKEVSSSNALAQELKAILNEAGAKVTLITDLAPDSPTEGTLVFVWKEKPTAKNLENAFKKYGYKVEIVGESITAAKGNANFSINLAEGENCQKISVRLTNKAIKSNGTVTMKECAELKAIALRASYLLTAKNDIGNSAIWSKKLYDKMDAYGKKYGVTRDDIAEACRAKTSEPGFDKEVEKQAQELGITIK